MKSTLISHFYNEEFLLPHWLKHHVELFDHGILIDYHSTDNSVDIIRTLAPHWEVKKTKNEHFLDWSLNEEVQEIEQGIDGWKMALNTTEFLFLDDLNVKLKEYERRDIRAIRTEGIIMVDDVGSAMTSQPLLKQKHKGYVERFGRRGGTDCLRHRLLHRNDVGLYGSGRHRSNWTIDVDIELMLCWFFYCPWNETMIRRAAQHCDHVPKESMPENWFNNYTDDHEVLNNKYKWHSSFSYDLLIVKPYREMYIKLWH